MTGLQTEIRTSAEGRIISLDQFRGFAIFGMILVNYLGYFEVIPETFKHPRYGMTFANAIAPYFVFVVGMGFRMSLIRRISEKGKSTAYWHAFKRYWILILIGVVVYGPDPVTDMWDALVDIGFAGLLTLPFIVRSQATRFSMAFLFLTLYQLLFAYTGYGEWTMANSIDGGPLGPLSWASILVFGTIQMDYLQRYSGTAFLSRSLYLGIPLMVLGYALSLLHPYELWTFSQRSMTMAYPLLSAGLSVCTYALFYYVNDMRRIRFPHLQSFGLNPLTIYILQQVLTAFYGRYLPKEAPLWQALAGFAIIYSICYAVARHLRRQGIVIKI